MEKNSNPFFKLPDEDKLAEDAKVVIVPVPYETDECAGVSKAPAAIQVASQHVALFDEELWVEPYKVGVLTMDSIKLESQTAAEQPFEELTKVLVPAIEHGTFPVCIGGSSDLSVGAIRACLGRYQNLSVLQITADSNLSTPNQGAKSGCSISQRIYNLLKEPILTQVGITDITADEVRWMEESQPEVNIFWARQQDRWDFQDIISTLSDNVYLSIDINALEAGLVPTADHPNPGGIGYYKLVELIKNLCVRRNIVAADIVNLKPVENLHGPEALAARLLYKIIGYRFALQLGVTKKYL